MKAGGSAPSDAAAGAGGVQARARIAVLWLGARSVLQQVVILVANVYLTRQLGPADYGVFAILQFALALFALVGDVGLGAALIQKPGEPDDIDLSTIWWTQLGLASLIVAVAFLGGPYVLRFWPDMPAAAPWLLRGLSVGLLLSVLRSVPALLLERRLRFGWLATIETVGTIGFYATAVALAYSGHGAGALVTASVAQAALSTILIFIAQPWRPKLIWNRERLRPLLSFGLAVQGKNVVGFANSAVTPAVAGALIGREALGLLVFAQNTAWFPLQLVNIVGRVSFPAYSRLQHDRAELGREIERAVTLCGGVTFLFVAIMGGLGPQLVEVIYGQKWMPAIPALYVYLGAISVGFLAPVLGPAFDALGKPQLLFRLAAAWALINWVAVVVATHFARTPLMFALGYSVHIVVGNIAIAWLLERELRGVRLMRRLLPSAVALVLATALGRALFASAPPSLTTALAGPPVVAGIFLVLVFSLDRSLRGTVKSWVARKTSPG